MGADLAIRTSRPATRPGRFEAASKGISCAPWDSPLSLPCAAAAAAARDMELAGAGSRPADNAGNHEDEGMGAAGLADGCSAEGGGKSGGNQALFQYTF